MNRWWTLILALALGVASLSAMPAISSANDDFDGVLDRTGGTSSPTPPQGSGDPDSPSGSGKLGVQDGGGTFYGTIGGTASDTGVGDASRRSTVAIWMKVRVALGVLKLYYLRF